MAKIETIDLKEVLDIMREDGVRRPEDVISELSDELDGELHFARVPTPIVGPRIMAGVGTTMTHFWDADDGWQQAPKPISLPAT